MSTSSPTSYPNLNFVSDPQPTPVDFFDDVNAPLEALLSEDLNTLSADALRERLALLDKLTKTTASLHGAMDEEVVLTKDKPSRGGKGTKSKINLTALLAGL